jgi:hypothetical protein
MGDPGHLGITGLAFGSWFLLLITFSELSQIAENMKYFRILVNAGLAIIVIPWLLIGILIGGLAVAGVAGALLMSLVEAAIIIGVISPFIAWRTVLVALATFGAIMVVNWSVLHHLV